MYCKRGFIASKSQASVAVVNNETTIDTGIWNETLSLIEQVQQYLMKNNNVEYDPGWFRDFPVWESRGFVHNDKKANKS